MAASFRVRTSILVVAAASLALPGCDWFRCNDPDLVINFARAVRDAASGDGFVLASAGAPSLGPQSATFHAGSFRGGRAWSQLDAASQQPVAVDLTLFVGETLTITAEEGNVGRSDAGPHILGIIRRALAPQADSVLVETTIQRLAANDQVQRILSMEALTEGVAVLEAVADLWRVIRECNVNNNSATVTEASPANVSNRYIVVRVIDPRDASGAALRPRLVQPDEPTASFRVVSQ